MTIVQTDKFRKGIPVVALIIRGETTTQSLTDRPQGGNLYDRAYFCRVTGTWIQLYLDILDGTALDFFQLLRIPHQPIVDIDERRTMPDDGIFVILF